MKKRLLSLLLILSLCMSFCAVTAFAADNTEAPKFLPLLLQSLFTPTCLSSITTATWSSMEPACTPTTPTKTA